MSNPYVQLRPPPPPTSGDLDDWSTAQMEAEAARLDELARAPERAAEAADELRRAIVDRQAAEAQAEADRQRAEAGPYDHRGEPVASNGPADLRAVTTTAMVIIGDDVSDRFHLATLLAHFHASAAARLDADPDRARPVRWVTEGDSTAAIDSLSGTLRPRVPFVVDRRRPIVSAAVINSARTVAAQAIVLDLADDRPDLLAEMTDLTTDGYNYRPGTDNDRHRDGRWNRPAVITSTPVMPSAVPIGWRIVTATATDPDWVPERLTGHRWSTVDVVDVVAGGVTPGPSLILAHDIDRATATLEARA